MKRWLGTSVSLIMCIFSSPGFAEVRLPADSPFQVILDRNPFGLRPPPTNVVVVTQTSAPPAQVSVNLSGITEFRGQKRAWMVIPAGGTRTNTVTFSMSVGDPEFEGVKVEHIDVQRGVVQIQKSGVPTTLDFQNHGLAYTAPVAMPGPAGSRPGRGAVRAGVPAPNPAVRTVMPAANPTGSVVQPDGGRTATANPPQVVPARAIRTAQPENVQPVDPAAQVLQMKLQEMRAREQGRPFPPMPPVPGMDLGE